MKVMYILKNIKTEETLSYHFLNTALLDMQQGLSLPLLLFCQPAIPWSTNKSFNYQPKFRAKNKITFLKNYIINLWLFLSTPWSFYITNLFGLKLSRATPLPFFILLLLHPLTSEFMSFTACQGSPWKCWKPLLKDSWRSSTGAPLRNKGLNMALLRESNG